ncbi:MAG: transporter substrate-binding domain-containing protein [Desulfobulbus sp.]|nr:transporter substrate-binding domain-containing protein [Desulfobulbus sp.]
MADDASYAPFAFVDANGEPAGITIDIWKLWSKKTGIAVEFRLMQWDAVLNAVGSGKVDAVGGIFITPERQQYLSFSQPYISLTTSLFFHKQISGIRGLEDIQGFTVGVVSGDSGEELVRSRYPQAQLLKYPHAAALVEAAVQGKVKVFVVDRKIGRFYLARFDQEGMIRETGRPVATNEMSTAVRKGNTSLLAAIDAGFARITPEEIDRIEDTWGGKQQRSIFSRDEYRLYGIIALVVLAVVVVWNVQLRRTVNQSLAEVEQRNRALQESERRFTQIFDSAPIPMAFAAEADGFCGTTWNEAWYRTFGYPHEQADGHSGTDIGLWIIPDDRRRVLELAQEQDGVSGFEAQLSCYNGSVRTCSLYARFIGTRGNRLLMFIYIDITEKKKAEEELRVSESYNKVLFHDSRIPLAVIDPQMGIIIDANQAAVSLYGFAHRRELVGKDPKDMSPPTQEGGRASTWLARELMQRVVNEGSLVFEWRHQRPDGTLWEAEIHMMLFSHRKRQLLQLSLEDITGRKEAELERDKLQAQLLQSQKMESIGRLAGGVAHDFNNMLSVIVGHAELVLRKTDPQLPLYDNLQSIMEASQRSADLTRQLLTFARKQTVTPKVLDLNQTVEGMLKMVRRLIGEDIGLIWLPGEKTGKINMDPTQIDQLLVNLCVNARDAVGENGRITIETDAVVLDSDFCHEQAECRPGNYMLLSVSDNGTGIEQDLLPHLFEPFFTTKGLGKGTGLGLATVYGIVKQNDGWLQVESIVGNGTCFRIYLPIFRGKEERASEFHALPPAEPGTETILLVEDETMILDIGKIMLESLGYRVLAALTPGEALGLAREHVGEIHLLMTDVIMPEMNGRDLARQLLSLYPNLKRLFMSGYTADVIAHHGVLDEGVHFLQKPFTLDSLTFKVREALDNANDPGDGSSL